MLDDERNTPLCVCGCGQKVRWDAKRKRFSKKVDGHTGLSLNDVIRRSIDAHGTEKYRYDRSVYIGIDRKMEIFCVTCNMYFWQTPFLHMKGSGCYECGLKESANKCRWNKEKFVKKANSVHGIGRYDYSESEYVLSQIHIKIKCNRCNEFFMQRPATHVLGKGCWNCGGSKPLNENFVIESIKIHEERYDYSKVCYINVSTQVELRCNSCKKTFMIRPDSHLKGVGCSCYRNNFKSKIEQKWLSTINIPKQFWQYRIPKTRYIVDAFKDGIIYEFYGTYYHGDPREFESSEFNLRSQKTHGELFLKTIERHNFIESLGFKIKYVWQLDFDNGKLFSDHHPIIELK